MKNADVIKKFVNGETKGKTTNLRIEDDKLINYNTVLAVRNDDDTFVVNVTKYSQSTTTIQNKLIYSLYSKEVKNVSDIPMGARSL